jgi:predicted metal-dependent HD superfamily phosphohydrolase
LPAPEGGELARLLGQYSDASRYYHTLQHLGECLELLDEGSGLAVRPGEVAIALWYHDAVYDSRRSDNEAQSAEWAAQALRRVGAEVEVIERVGELILATRHTGPVAAGDVALMLDIDLAILGAPEERFEEYEDQIQLEYAWVPEPVFRPTRARILQGFVERERIYTTPAFAGRFEAPARTNLLRALMRLSA